MYDRIRLVLAKRVIKHDVTYLLSAFMLLVMCLLGVWLRLFNHYAYKSLFYLYLHCIWYFIPHNSGLKWKGNSVWIRDYTRSCKFYKCFLNDLCHCSPQADGKASKSRTSQKTCLCNQLQVIAFGKKSKWTKIISTQISKDWSAITGPLCHVVIFSFSSLFALH